VAARSNRFTEREARAAATAAVRSYREHVASIAEMSTLQAWYTSVSGLTETVGNPRLRKRYEKVVREERVHGTAHEFAELAHNVDGVPRIKDDPPLVYHADVERDPAFWRRAHRELRQYRNSLPDDRRVLFDRFQLCDMAVKVVGVGSVGTACAVLAGYMGKNATFDEGIADFAMDYSDQNERDHAGLVKAVRAGRIKVMKGK
jgi:uncharacterized protein DUF2252